jgi:hypothetical protein
MSSTEDQARLIAERVARRVAAGAEPSASPDAQPSARARQSNGEPVREELSAIREGLQDLESKLDRIESKIVQSPTHSAEPTRARLIDFVSSGPPLPVTPSITRIPETTESSAKPSTRAASFVPATHSPWARDFNTAAAHPSQERFGIEEATVAELVEFFESEKKCSIEPGGKPCDHCSMCSSRGF